MLRIDTACSKVIELTPDELTHSADKVLAWLTSGHVIVIRSLDQIKQLRAWMLDDAGMLGGAEVRAEIEGFYENGDELSLDSLFVLGQVLKRVRTYRVISQRFAPLLAGLQLPPPIYLDGGIPRLALPTDIVTRARASKLFTRTDFQRETDTGDTEIFMPRPANIHRDFNREHWTLMCNLWFPMHDCPADASIRLWPQHYRNPLVRDQDNTPENRVRLGAWASISLQFGDAVLFHGEIPHTSPEHPISGRRQSFDLRIACSCFDDNRGYRGNFVNFNNFLTGKADSPSFESDHPELAQEPLPDIPTPTHTANYYWLLAQHGANIRGSEIHRIMHFYSLYPFAEDRYVALARLAVRRGAPQLAENILEGLSQSSSNFFWQFLSGEILEEMGAITLAEAAYRRALSSAESSRLLSFSPIDYAKDTPAVPPNEQYARELNGRLSRLTGKVTYQY